MKINFKKLLIYIFITFLIANLFSIFIVNSNTYNNLNTIIDVPKFIFPIVWSILYLIMAISLYVISESYDKDKNKAIKIYFIQLIVNSLWTLIFFGLNLYTLSYIWIILLILLVIIMIIKFYNINKIIGLINIPYLLWLLFALYLNFTISLIN